jgi:hypothetical protein
MITNTIIAAAFAAGFAATAAHAQHMPAAADPTRGTPHVVTDSPIRAYKNAQALSQPADSWREANVASTAQSGHGAHGMHAMRHGQAGAAADPHAGHDAHAGHEGHGAHASGAAADPHAGHQPTAPAAAHPRPARPKATPKSVPVKPKENKNTRPAAADPHAGHDHGGHQ